MEAAVHIVYVSVGLCNRIPFKFKFDAEVSENNWYAVGRPPSSPRMAGMREEASGNLRRLRFKLTTSRSVVSCATLPTELNDWLLVDRYSKIGRLFMVYYGEHCSHKCDIQGFRLRTW